MTIILINYKSDHSICDDYRIDANGIWMDGDKSYKPVYGTITGGAKAKTKSLPDILTQWKITHSNVFNNKFVKKGSKSVWKHAGLLLSSQVQEKLSTVVN